MTVCRVSLRADADLLEIAIHTTRLWGEEQALRYADQLEACCRLVANNPGVARKCDDVRGGYRRIEEGSHVLFFKFDERGALLVRVLHERMLPGQHLTAADETENG